MVARLYHLIEERRKLFVSFEHSFEKGWVDLQLAFSGLEAFKSDDRVKVRLLGAETVYNGTNGLRAGRRQGLSGVCSGRRSAGRGL